MTIASPGGACAEDARSLSGGRHLLPFKAVAGAWNGSKRQYLQAMFMKGILSLRWSD